MIKLTNILKEIVVKPSRSGTVALLSPAYTDKSHLVNKPARAVALEYFLDFQEDYESEHDEADDVDYSPQIVRWDTDLYSVTESHPDGEVWAESYFIGPNSDLYDLALRQLDPSSKDDFNEAADDFALSLNRKTADTFTAQDVDQMP